MKPRKGRLNDPIDIVELRVYSGILSAARILNPAKGYALKKSISLVSSSVSLRMTIPPPEGTSDDQWKYSHGAFATVAFSLA